MIMRRFHCATLATVAAIGFASVASAADMPTKAPAYAPPVAFSWTGFYVGGQVGGGWASSTTTDVDATASYPAGFVDSAINYSGVLGGLYGGFNYQINQFVIGIDGDYSWADLTGSGSDTSPINGGHTNYSDKIKWVATLTGRLGYAMNYNWMIFVKGGGAWADFSGSSATFSAAGVNTSNGTASETRTGWTIGGGTEWGFAPHWSAKLEYDYVDFSTANWNSTLTNVATGAVTTPARSATSYMNIVKLGVAYRF
jgi:outer membrane immunogenic protein